jgi:hypothetical protein
MAVSTVLRAGIGTIQDRKDLWQMRERLEEMVEETGNSSGVGPQQVEDEGSPVNEAEEVAERRKARDDKLVDV